MPKNVQLTAAGREYLTNVAKIIETDIIPYYANMSRSRILNQQGKDSYLPQIARTKRLLYDRDLGYYQFFTPEERQNARFDYSDGNEMFDHTYGFARNQEKWWIDQANQYNGYAGHPKLPQSRIDTTIALLSRDDGYFVQIDGVYLIPTAGDMIRYLKQAILKPIHRVLGK